MVLYIAVTPDRYELPIAVGDSAADLAQQLRITESAVYHTISRHRAREKAGKPMKWSKWRIYRIDA